MECHHRALLIAYVHCERQLPCSRQTYWVGVVSSLETNTLRSIFAEVGEEQEIDLRDCFRTVEEGRVKLEGCQLVRGVWCSRRVTRS